MATYGQRIRNALEDVPETILNMLCENACINIRLLRPKHDVKLLFLLVQGREPDYLNVKNSIVQMSIKNYTAAGVECPLRLTNYKPIKTNKVMKATIVDYFGKSHEINEHEKNMLIEMESDIETLYSYLPEDYEASESDRFFRDLREICSPVEAYFEETYGSTFLFSH